LKPEKAKQFQCDHCPQSFDLAKVLGTHKRTAHGIAGQSKGAITARARKAAAKTVAAQPGNLDPQQCPLCSFVAKWQGGLTKHMNAAHPDAITTKPKTRKELQLAKRAAKVPVTLNGHAPEEGQRAQDAVTETILAIALGRFQGLCTSMATEFDIPPRMFARRFSELVYRTQVR